MVKEKAVNEKIAKENLYERIKNKALELGASDAKVIDVAGIKTGSWTRWKCQFGCPNYGKRLTCPPHVPSYDETQQFLSEYKDAMLVQFTIKLTSDDIANYDEKDRENSNKMHKIMLELEKEAFLGNLYKAFSLKPGTCHLCKECGKVCRHPREARPSMEAVGIDAFAIVRENGYAADVIDSSASEDGSTQFKMYALLLLD